MSPSARDLAELVRLPAALTVPGDVWAGAAWAGPASGGLSGGLSRGPMAGAGAMPLGSVLLYWSGMALNDWADREVDAVERPERVIPSGRMTPSTALGVAAVLGGAGLAVSAVAGGRRALAVSVPLAVLVAAYDVVAKDSPAGPVVMAGTRGLDVLLGATAAPGAAVVPAVAPAVAAATHTVGVTLLSRGEVHGTRPASAYTALAATATAAGMVVAASLRDGGVDSDARPWHRWAAAGFVAAYVAKVGGAQARAAQEPTGPQVRAATGAGIGGLTLLQAAWLAARGRLATAAVVAGAGPVLKRAAREVSPT